MASKRYTIGPNRGWIRHDVEGCGLSSHNSHDIDHRFCAACRTFMDPKVRCPIPGGCSRRCRKREQNRKLETLDLPRFERFLADQIEREWLEFTDDTIDELLMRIVDVPVLLINHPNGTAEEPLVFILYRQIKETMSS